MHTYRTNIHSTGQFGQYFSICNFFQLGHCGYWGCIEYIVFCLSTIRPGNNIHTHTHRQTHSNNSTRNEICIDGSEKRIYGRKMNSWDIHYSSTRFPKNRLTNEHLLGISENAHTRSRLIHIWLAMYSCVCVYYPVHSNFIVVLVSVFCSKFVVRQSIWFHE